MTTLNIQLPTSPTKPIQQDLSLVSLVHLVFTTVQAPVLTCRSHVLLLPASGAEFKAIGGMYEKIDWTNPNAACMNR